MPVKDRSPRRPNKRSSVVQTKPSPRPAQTGRYVDSKSTKMTVGFKPPKTAVDNKPTKSIHIYVHERINPERGTVRDTAETHTIDEKRSLTPDVIGTLTTATASFSLLGGVPFGLPGVIVGALVGFAIGAVNQKDKLFTAR